mmetsp:Transcript_33890/g.80738  ORF Transcript_33890/g.80738 Transcript_33890/m.80738 type:complete len:447 (-) Transcript_33890:139-1479(-)
MEDLKKTAVMTKERCRALADALKEKMVLGLAGGESDLKMLPTYVTSFPTGKESGHFLALDLGGTNFRVLSVRIDPSTPEVTHVKFKKFSLETKHMQGTADVLFTFLADCISAAVLEFEGALPPAAAPLHLGFTFSFPVEQTALNHGTLIRWTKGFNASGVEGADVVALLQKALKEQDVHVIVDALANDTVGTLMTIATKQPKAAVGVILGTGTNACYVEKIEKIGKWKGGAVASGEMCINMEWGNFGALESSRAHLPITPCDAAMDAASLNAGQQILEKIIGGMYMGELGALFFNAVADGGGALAGVSQRIAPGKLTTELMATFHSEETPMDGKAVAEVLRGELGVEGATDADGAVLQEACRVVAKRAARVAASAVAAIVEHAGRVGQETVVGIDGSVFKLYPGFKQEMEQTLQDLLEANARCVKLEMSEDGSGLGAAIIAATASR